MTRKRGWRKLILGLLAAAICLGVLFVELSRAYPMLGAKGADELRKILGDPAVAQMEAVMFKVDDTVKSIEFRLGLAKSDSPWTTSAQASLATTPPNPHLNAPSAPPAVLPPANALQPLSPKSAQSWPPVDLKPLGSLPGEGAWSPYIQDATGQTVAYRTFLQPDINRPYAVVAIVALNLEQ
ncbi:MAG: hypothetical protein PHQ40_18105, partial [Anaerolineaceae bacterium]|nr:hypothetical protein [Anaerolineaceae bacterium]